MENDLNIESNVQISDVPTSLYIPMYFCPSKLFEAGISSKLFQLLVLTQQDFLRLCPDEIDLFLRLFDDRPGFGVPPAIDVLRQLGALYDAPYASGDEVVGVTAS